MSVFGGAARSRHAVRRAKPAKAIKPAGRHRVPIDMSGRHRGEGEGQKRVRQASTRLAGDTLLSNSLYLMLNTAAMAVLGFVVWLLAARLYHPSDVGVGTTLISASGLLGLASLLGLNNSLVRYLPTSSRRDSHVNTALLLVLGASVTLACGYVLLLPWIAPELAFVHDSPLLFVGFALFTAGTALNLVTDSVFIAYRAAKYNLLLDGGLQSISKIVLVVALQGSGAFAIFAASGGAAALAVVASVYVLTRRFELRPRFAVDREAVAQVAHFAGANYVASLLNLSPILLLPLIVIDRLGTASAGYFYIALMIANVVFSVAYSVSQSVFAEASYGEQSTGEIVRRGTRILLVLLLPAGLLLAVASPLLMAPFGHDYSRHAAGMLAVFGLSAPLVAVVDMCGAAMRARNLTVRYVVLMAIYAVAIIALAIAWSANLTGVGWAWFASNGFAAVVGVLMLMPGWAVLTRGPARPPARSLARLRRLRPAAGPEALTPLLSGTARSRPAWSPRRRSWRAARRTDACLSPARCGRKARRPARPRRAR